MIGSFPQHRFPSKDPQRSHLVRGLSISWPQYGIYAHPATWSNTTLCLTWPQLPLSNFMDNGCNNGKGDSLLFPRSVAQFHWLTLLIGPLSHLLTYPLHHTDWPFYLPPYLPDRLEDPAPEVALWTQLCGSTVGSVSW